jgi:LAO/AO transport system kinase
VVILAPGLGDDIQAMKSGLLEIADIIVVNKADREGADRTAHQLMGALSIRPRESTGVPVLKTTATSGEGIAPLAAAIAAAGRRQTAADPLERRRRRARYLIARAASDRLAARVKAGGGSALDALADGVLSGALSPDEAARRLLDGQSSPLS